MRTSRFPRSATLLGCALLLPLSSRAQATAPVAIRATATTDYTQRHIGTAGPVPEGYVFYQGQYFPGMAHDPHMEGTEFIKIAESLARGLAKQNFYPVKTQKDASLLLVVHWGATLVEENPIRTFQQDDFNGAQSSYNQQVKSLGVGSADPSGITFNLMISQNEGTATQS